eukprot:gene1720-1919_t
MLIEKQGSYGSAILGHEDEWRYLVPGRWGRDALLGDMEKTNDKNSPLFAKGQWQMLKIYFN